MARLSLATAPALEPVTVTMVKSHLRIDVDDDDLLLLDQIQTARERAEKFLNRAIITQTWDLYMDAFPGGNVIELPRPPLQSVTTVKYTPNGGSQTTYNSSNYTVDIVSEPGRIVLNSTASWPTDTLEEVNGVVIRFVAGYGANPANVPAFIRQAILLLVGDMYENRENVIVGTMAGKIPMSAEYLMWMERNKGF